MNEDNLIVKHVRGDSMLGLTAASCVVMNAFGPQGFDEAQYLKVLSSTLVLGINIYKDFQWLKV